MMKISRTMYEKRFEEYCYDNIDDRNFPYWRSTLTTFFLAIIDVYGASFERISPELIHPKAKGGADPERRMPAVLPYIKKRMLIRGAELRHANKIIDLYNEWYNENYL